MPDDLPPVPITDPPLAPDQHATLFDEVGKLVSQSGGVGGLAQQFEQQGLGGMISSWVTHGANAPMMGEEVLQVLGHDRVMAIAAKAGLSEAQVTSGISQILPQVIDHLTPQGTVPEHAPSEIEGALGMLKSRFFGGA